MRIQKDLPKPKVDFLNLYNISWIGGFSAIEWLALLAIGILVYLSKHFRLFWRIILGYVWFKRTSHKRGWFGFLRPPS